MKRNDGWMNALFALMFIAAPALVGFYFLLPEWSGKETISYGSMWLVAMGFMFYVAIFSFILIFFKILSFESLSFNIPLTLVFIALFVTGNIPLYARALIVIGIIFLSFPINIGVGRLKKEIEFQIKNKKIK